MSHPGGLLLGAVPIFSAATTGEGADTLPIARRKGTLSAPHR